VNGGASGKGVDAGGQNDTAVWFHRNEINDLAISYPDGINWTGAQDQYFDANNLRFESSNNREAAVPRSTKKTLPRIAVVLGPGSGTNGKQS